LRAKKVSAFSEDAFMSKRFLTAACAVAAISVVMVATAMPASAASFFWFKGPTKAPREKVCLSFARDQAKRAGLQDIKVDALSVSGTKNGSFAIITCVGVVTVVMVSGDNGTDGGPLAKQLFTGMRGEACIDGC
jgi:hypothetical protein